MNLLFLETFHGVIHFLFVIIGDNQAYFSTISTSEISAYFIAELILKIHLNMSTVVHIMSIKFRSFCPSVHCSCQKIFLELFTSD